MWVLHLGYIVVLLMFPFYGEHTLKKKTTLIHIISVPITLILSSIPSIVAMAAGGYSIHMFPPVVCIPANTDLTYYTLILPASVIACTMTILCILLVSLIHKVSLYVCVYVCVCVCVCMCAYACVLHPYKILCTII